MGLFSTSPQKRAKNAWASGDRTKRTLERVAVESRKLDYRLHTLYKLASDLPPNMPADAIKNVEVSMTITERHANQMLKHLEQLNEHITKIDEHLKKIETKK